MSTMIIKNVDMELLEKQKLQLIGINQLHLSKNQNEALQRIINMLNNCNPIHLSKNQNDALHGIINLLNNWSDDG